MCWIKLHYGVGLSQYIGGIISINSGLNIIYSGLNIMHSGINLIYSVGLSQIMDPFLPSLLPSSPFTSKCELF